mgnify:CR=1 FL=1
MEEIIKKRCNRCLLEKDVTLFYKCKRSSDGLSFECSECSKSRHYERKSNIIIPEYKFCKTCQNTKSSSLFGRENNKKDGLHYECLDCHWNVEKRLLYLLTTAKHSAAMRSKKDTERGRCEITIEMLVDLFFRQEGKCHISGMDLCLTPNPLYVASLERVNEAGGYTEDNVVIVCKAFNSFHQMNREKLYYITQHNDTPMNHFEIEEHLLHLGFFNATASTHRKDDRVERGIETDITAEQIMTKFVDQRGLCAYSGVRMYTVANVPAFKMSVERVDRSKGHTIDNIVLIILELNIGGKLNLTREIVQEWRRKVSIADTFDLEQLRAKWDASAKIPNDNRICKKCQVEKPVVDFRASSEGNFYLACRPCRREAERMMYKRCTECKRTRHIKCFAVEALICTGCHGPSTPAEPPNKRIRLT